MKENRRKIKKQVIINTSTQEMKSNNVETISGLQYYSNGEGGKILHLPITITDNVKCISDDGKESVDLQGIIQEQFNIIELKLKKDIFNLYLSTTPLHGNEVCCRGSLSVLSVELDRRCMDIDNELDPNLPFIEI